MEVKETYYGILGIETNATEDDIRKAYRKQGTIIYKNTNFFDVKISF
jgi:preprotein translocase subunit Sec63